MSPAGRGRNAWDLDVMRRTVWGEARGEGFVGMLAVAWVILNRVTDGKRWNGESVSGVCQVPYQFSCWNSDDPNRPKLDTVTVDDPAFLTATGICALLLAGHTMGDFADPTGAADHYHTRAVAPAWAQSSKMVHTRTIGSHVFYREG